MEEVTSPEVIAQQKEDLNEFVHDLVYKMIENAQIESKVKKIFSEFSHIFLRMPKSQKVFVKHRTTSLLTAS